MNDQAQGIWESTEPYAQKVKFNLNQPVLVTFPSDFKKPEEMPATKEGDKPFCKFDVLVGEDQVDSVIMTSSITLLRNLKTHMPLAGKSIMITKKNVGGKNYFYVEDAAQFAARNNAEPKEVDTDNAGLDEEGKM